MSEMTKPVPKIDADSAAFWNGARDKHLVLPTCEDCGRSHYYPRAICPYCHSLRLTHKRMSGEGTIYSFTVQRQPAGAEFAPDVPYVVALVDTAEGPRLLSRIMNAAPESVTIGQRVRACFVEVTEDITLPCFEVLQ